MRRGRWRRPAPTSTPTDPDGTTPLVLRHHERALRHGHCLLEAGADPNITDTAGMAALYAAVDMSSLGEVYGMPPRKVQDTLKPTDLISRLIAKGSVGRRAVDVGDAAAQPHAWRAAARCGHDAADARGEKWRLRGDEDPARGGCRSNSQTTARHARL